VSSFGCDTFGAAAATAAAPAPDSAVPSVLQNFAFGGFNVPQVGQATEPGMDA
jgi:hypothetical protein